MGDVIRRTFIVGDLVTIAPGFRNSVLDFDFEKYIGIIVKIPDINEYIVYWTRAPVNSFYKGMWNGDHLIKVEHYKTEKQKIGKNLRLMEL